MSSASLSGTVLGQPTGPFRGGSLLEGLEGVIVRVGTGAGAKQAATDADGNFIVLQPPSGMQFVHIDGANVATGQFSELEIAIVVGGGATNLTQSVVLPNLDFGETTNVAVDAGGVTTADMMVGDPAVDGFSLDIPTGTTITVDGAPPVGSVDVNVTPVDGINVPMPLPGTLNPGAFVSISPAGAAFDPALGITLPNTEGFPLGTQVDIWSFDHDEGAWVNRSEQTGNQGVVMVLGGMNRGTAEFIVAEGVITEGGWHSAVLNVDPTCATTISGRVLQEGKGDVPLADVLIGLSTGQFAVTAADGTFSIPSVPAYDASMLPKACVATDIELRAIAPVSFGAQTVFGGVEDEFGATITPGGTTTIPDIRIPVTATGSLVGSVTDLNGDPVQGTVAVTTVVEGELNLETDEFGTFFKAAIDPGNYLASFEFESGKTDQESFAIVQGETTVVNLVEPGGAPPVGLEVHVVDFTSETLVGPIPGACVTAQGATGGPLFATTDANGIAAFPTAPAGPYSVTAQLERTVTKGVVERVAASLLGVNAPAGTIVLPFFDTAQTPDPIVTDATLEGTLSNAPAGVDLDYQIEVDLGNQNFFASGAADSGFMADIPSGLPLDVAVTARDQLSGELVSAVFFPDVTATVGQNVVLDFDFANARPFDQTVTLNYNNEQTTHDEFFADLSLGDLDFPSIDDSFPSTDDWPDFSHADFADLPPFFEVGSIGYGGGSSGFEEVFCDFALGNTTPSALKVTFLGLPTITSPAHLSMVTSWGPGSTVQYTAGTGNGSTAGFDSISFFHESANLFSFWDILVAPGTTLVTLPPVFASKPMYSLGFVALNVETFRFDFPGFVFANFFDQNFPANVAAVEATDVCGANKSHFFDIVTPAQTLAPRKREHRFESALRFFHR